MLVHIPLLEELLNPYVAAMGRDAAGYRNHVYRVVNLAWSSGGGNEAALQRLVVAAVFHDLGLWTADTLDYLHPSQQLAQVHLHAVGQTDWVAEVDAMIANHHRIRPCASSAADPVERFRRADWCDVSRGLLHRQGFDPAFVACLNQTFPAQGFRCRLLRRVLWHALTHPFNPLPMLRR